jgi:hypothetical protein
LYTTLPPHDVDTVKVPVVGKQAATITPETGYCPSVHAPGAAVNVLQLGAIKFTGANDTPVAEKVAVAVHAPPDPHKLGIE